MKKYKNIILIITIILLIFIPLNSFAIDFGAYKDIYNKPKGIDSLNTSAGKILGVVQAVGSGIAVIMLIVIGIKYVIASVDEKAKLKETLTVYIIGAILLFAGSNLLTIIVKFAREASNS